MRVTLDGYLDVLLPADTNASRVRNGLRRLFRDMANWRVLGKENLKGSLTDTGDHEVGDWEITA